MDDEKLNEFRMLIAARLEEIKGADERGKEGQSIVTLDQQAVGRLSRMDALQNQAMAKADHTRRELETARLRGALARIENGDFGFCEDCGEEIAQGRLRFDPAALLCISCASG